MAELRKDAITEQKAPRVEFFFFFFFLHVLPFIFFWCHVRVPLIVKHVIFHCCSFCCPETARVLLILVGLQYLYLLIGFFLLLYLAHSIIKS